MSGKLEKGRDNSRQAQVRALYAAYSLQSSCIDASAEPGPSTPFSVVLSITYATANRSSVRCAHTTAAYWNQDTGIHDITSVSGDALKVHRLNRHEFECMYVSASIPISVFLQVNHVINASAYQASKCAVPQSDIHHFNRWVKTI
ncbi:hypothetical protein M378DRAFT_162411 [Amanita muscaria Koide BX008]|uniref:Uncharacterized protein n=1 Tax=Amanita muscaria (strain Koide BX008) TaxID=946122 RepID=A0A0C2X774_AMAMK|nr:hypothetical protein M378DRAFT_162411 [Amanita muscaria Koide BX008]